VRRNTLMTDVLIALVLAILVIVISPGLAVVGLLAILVVVICGLSLLFDRRRRRSRRDEGLDLSGLREAPPRRQRPPQSARSRSRPPRSRDPRSRPPR
jgi:hypothetical protein